MRAKHQGGVSSFFETLPFCEAAPQCQAQKIEAPPSEFPFSFFNSTTICGFDLHSARFLILLFALYEGDTSVAGALGDSAGGQRHLFDGRSLRPGATSRLPHRYL